MQKQYKKVVLYIAQSIDGYIARPNDSLDWLNSNANSNEGDHGYSEFLKTIDTTLMGNTTYQWVVNEGVPNPYPGQKNYVFTRNKSKWEKEDKNYDKKYVEYIDEDPVSFVNNLKTTDNISKDIWLVGGSQLNTTLLEAQMIDRIIISIAPVIIGKGKKLFAETKSEDFLQQFNILSTKTYSTGFLQVIYEKK